MTNENNDKEKHSASKGQQHQPQPVALSAQQKKQGSQHDKTSCTNPTTTTARTKWCRMPPSRTTTASPPARVRVVSEQFGTVLVSGWGYFSPSVLAAV